MVCSGPELDHVISLVSKFMSNIEKSHWKAIKQTMRRKAISTIGQANHFGNQL